MTLRNAARTGTFIGITRCRGPLPLVSTSRNQLGLTSTSRPFAGRKTDKPLKFTLSIFNSSNSVIFLTPVPSETSIGERKPGGCRYCTANE